MGIKEEVTSLKKDIAKAQNAEEVARQKIKLLQLQCGHEDLTINSWGTADCKICEKHFSWYCPTSPTLVCDYEQEDGSYDEDCCRYCGNPEERK